MAAYSGTPTVNSAWQEGTRQGKLVRVRKNLTLTISSQGGTSNVIAATALGFRAGSLTLVIPVNYTDGSAQNRAIYAWTDGTNVLLGDPQAATDAARGEPTDMTGTLQIEVAGLRA